MLQALRLSPCGRSPQTPGEESDGKTRYARDGDDGLRRISYVGTAATRATIPTGTLVRLSLSRRFAPTAAHDGYWLQLSGWY